MWAELQGHCRHYAKCFCLEMSPLEEGYCSGGFRSSAAFFLPGLLLLGPLPLRPAAFVRTAVLVAGVRECTL